MGVAWVECTGALDPLSCCHVSKNGTKLNMKQHLNGSSAPVHWTQAFPEIILALKKIPSIANKLLSYVGEFAKIRK